MVIRQLHPNKMKNVFYGNNQHANPARRICKDKCTRRLLTSSTVPQNMLNITKKKRQCFHNCEKEGGLLHTAYIQPETLKVTREPRSARLRPQAPGIDTSQRGRHYQKDQGRYSVLNMDEVRTPLACSFVSVPSHS